MHQTKKASIKPTFSSMGTQETVKFQQEYKRALKAQNKTFNQNGKIPKVLLGTDRLVFMCREKHWFEQRKRNSPQQARGHILGKMVFGPRTSNVQKEKSSSECWSSLSKHFCAQKRKRANWAWKPRVCEALVPKPGQHQQGKARRVVQQSVVSEEQNQQSEKATAKSGRQSNSTSTSWAVSFQEHEQTQLQCQAAPINPVTRQKELGEKHVCHQRWTQSVQRRSHSH